MDLGRTLPANVERELLDEVVTLKQFVERLVQTVAEGVVHVDDAYKIVRFNGAAQRMLGHANFAAVGSDFSTLLHHSNHVDPFSEPSEHTTPVDLVLRDTAGKPVFVRARCAHARSADRRLGGLFRSLAPGR